MRWLFANKKRQDAQKEELKHILNEFAQNLPGPPIKLIHTPKEVVEQRTKELVEETAGKILKLI